MRPLVHVLFALFALVILADVFPAVGQPLAYHVGYLTVVVGVPLLLAYAIVATVRRV